jgi:Ca2+-transporting ATPase
MRRVSAKASAPVHARTSDEVLTQLASTRDGLSDAEARCRLAEFGPNALHVAKPRSAWTILLDQLRSVVVLLLIAAAGICADHPGCS